MGGKGGAHAQHSGSGSASRARGIQRREPREGARKKRVPNRGTVCGKAQTWEGVRNKGG